MTREQEPGRGWTNNPASATHMHPLTIHYDYFSKQVWQPYAPRVVTRQGWKVWDEQQERIKVGLTRYDSFSNIHSLYSNFLVLHGSYSIAWFFPYAATEPSKYIALMGAAYEQV